MNKYGDQSSAWKWRVCLSKKAFESPDEANQRGMMIYRCRLCGWWHRASASKQAHPAPAPHKKRSNEHNRKRR